MADLFDDLNEIERKVDQKSATKPFDGWSQAGKDRLLRDVMGASDGDANPSDGSVVTFTSERFMVVWEAGFNAGWTDRAEPRGRRVVTFASEEEATAWKAGYRCGWTRCATREQARKQLADTARNAMLGAALMALCLGALLWMLH
jgi:hypothetical protein